MKLVLTRAVQKPAPQPKRVLPLILLFFLFLLLLACNGFIGLTSHPIPHPTKDPIPIPTPQLLSLNHEIQQFSFQPSNNNNNISHPKPRLNKRIKAMLRTLHPTLQSRQFSERTNLFFSDQRCETRFFMTWISNLDSFTRRELYSIEALFRFHPKACLLIVSASMDTPAGTRILKPFKAFRVTAVTPDYTFLFNNTPAGSWFDRLCRGEVSPGDVSLGQNLSNLLRLAVLYNYGGVYLDTDVIILKSFNNLRNVIGAQAVDPYTLLWTRLNNAVMVFDRHHPLLFNFMEEFARTFDGNKWGHNGPYLVSRVVRRLGGFDNFTILPPEAFYPVGWSRIAGLFKGPKDGPHSRWIGLKTRRLREESYAVHLWNRQSRKVEVEEGSVIGRILIQTCLFCNSSIG